MKELRIKYVLENIKRKGKGTIAIQQLNDEFSSHEISYNIAELDFLDINSNIIFFKEFKDGNFSIEEQLFIIKEVF